MPTKKAPTCLPIRQWGAYTLTMNLPKFKTPKKTNKKINQNIKKNTIVRRTSGAEIRRPGNRSDSQPAISRHLIAEVRR